MGTDVGIGRIRENLFKKGGKVLVSKVLSANEKDLKEDILKSIELLGGLGKIVEKGDEILLKPNFNMSDAPPGSSDPDFVKTVIELLYEHGASKVVLGESSMFSLSTRKVLEETGMFQRKKVIGSFEDSSLTDDPWSYTQIRRAAGLGIGVSKEDE